MSTTGEHPAVPSAEESGESLLDSRTRKTLTDVRLLLGIGAALLVSVFGGGWVALGQVRTEAKDAAVDATHGLATEQKALKANVDDMRNELSDLKAEVRELRKDLRVVFPRLPAMDGGQ